VTSDTSIALLPGPGTAQAQLMCCAVNSQGLTACAPPPAGQPVMVPCSSLTAGNTPPSLVTTASLAGEGWQFLCPDGSTRAIGWQNAASTSAALLTTSDNDPDTVCQSPAVCNDPVQCSGPPCGGTSPPCAAGKVCSSNGMCIDATPPAATAHPIESDYTFYLDPWGRLNGNLAQPPFQYRYNQRWTQLAVNLVGTGIRDCTNPLAPPDCYTNPYVLATLSQSGPSWTLGYAGAMVSLDYPYAVVEGLKALAAEEVADPVTNGFTQPYFGAIARPDFSTRPFNGTYKLAIAVKPETVISNIQSIQILQGQSYWEGSQSGQ
jgi:hypothetical protein